MEVKKGLKLEKGTEMKENLMGMLRPADMFVQMRVIERKIKRDHVTKCPRAETRTNCQVRMGVVLDQEKGKYNVAGLVLEHNHILQLPETSQ